MNSTFNPILPLESVYIHWPFCPYKCHFCPFVALAGHDDYMEYYHTTLCQEIEVFSRQQVITAPLKTLFLGGGTPSTYPCNYLLDMFDRLNTVFTFAPDAEISIEVNPGTVTEQRLKTWKKVGINRLSIGVQSLNDTVLTSLNRHQKAADVLKLINNAAPLFENLSIDLILGLPGISHEEWKRIVEQVTSWPLKHISIYFLTIHENTPLYFNVHKKRIMLPADDEIIDVYTWTVDYLQAHGFIQYEISNFAQSGYHSRHNSAYWARVPYKGFGLGACSFDGERRFQNEKNLMKYCEGVAQSSSITIFSETLTSEQAWLEKVMLGLRQMKGISFFDLFNGLSAHQSTALQKHIDILCQKGLLRSTSEGIALTYQGLVVENEVIVTLCAQHT